jgi:uncharacterized LabA/DUF88 family protein
MPECRYLFIDGAYLSNVVNIKSSEYFNNELKYLDMIYLCNQYRKIFYYDCLPTKKESGDNSEYEEKHNYLNSLRLFKRFHVYEGTISGEGKRRRQKQVDILIAVHMLTHTFNKNMTEVTLLAGDLDFKPLVDALVQEGMYVCLLCDKTSASKNLMYSADVVNEIDVGWIYNYSPKEIKKNHKIPSATETGPLNKANFNKIRTGVNQEGVKFDWYFGNERNIIEYPYENLPDRVIQLEHNNPIILEHFVKERGLKIEWKKC